jgi:hypothetical protein
MRSCMPTRRRCPRAAARGAVTRASKPVPSSRISKPGRRQTAQIPVERDQLRLEGRRGGRPLVRGRGDGRASARAACGTGAGPGRAGGSPVGARHGGRTAAVPGGAARQPPPNAARWCARHGLAGATGLTTTFARRPAVTRARRHRAADHARVGPRDRRAPARSSSLRAESRRSSLRRAARPRRGSTRTRRRRAHRTCRSAPGRRCPSTQQRYRLSAGDPEQHAQCRADRVSGMLGDAGEGTTCIVLPASAVGR